MKRYTLLPLLLLGCTTARLTSSWTAPQAGGSDYKKILVVALVPAADSVMRNEMEAHVTGDLKTIGYQTVAFHQTFRAADLQYLRYDSVRNRLKTQGVDAVLTIRLLAKEDETVYVPQRLTEAPGDRPLGRFWEPLPSIARQPTGKTSEPITSTHLYWNSAFYDVNSLDLLYTAQTKATDVASAKRLAHRYGKLLVNDLQKRYLLTPKR